MIQTLHTTYYTVTKYKNSEIILPSTNGTMYNLGDIIQSKYDSISDWIDVSKENCKRFTKVYSTKKVRSERVSQTLIKKPETEIKKARRKTYLANDKLAYHNKINHPNYNYFSPLTDAETKAKPRSATMADEAARQRFMKAMNGDYNASQTTP
jgi:hypothetical protein